MTDYDQPITLFLGDPKGDRPIYEIWLGKDTGEIHIQIHLWSTVSVDISSFDRLFEAMSIAKAKLDDLRAKSLIEIPKDPEE